MTRSVRWVVGLILALPATLAPAAEIFVNIPGVNGQQPAPGYPSAMQVRSLSIQPGGFDFVKPIDEASPELIAAVLQGTPLSPAVLMYDFPPPPVPNALLPFQSMQASSYEAHENGVDEVVSFVGPTPGSIFLELPGVIGEESLPGHPNVMRLDQVTLLALDFVIERPVGSASPQLMQAAKLGTQFSTARLLFYDSANPDGPPDAVFNFGTLFIPVYQITAFGERVAFNFVTVPEPATSWIIALLVPPLLRRRRRNGL